MRIWPDAMADYAPRLTARRRGTSASEAPGGIDRPKGRCSGVRYGAILRHADDRGSFRELWRAGDFQPDKNFFLGVWEHRFVQANLSDPRPGRPARAPPAPVARTTSGSSRTGRAFVALVDVRPMLRGRDRPRVETRELGPDDWVDIPMGVAHGFLALDPLQLIYLVTNEYDGRDELGFAWDDRLPIPWPTLPETQDGRPIVSARDRTNPPPRSSWCACAPTAETPLRCGAGPDRTPPSRTRRARRATRRGYGARDHGAIETGARFGEAGYLDPALIPGVSSCAEPSPPCFSSLRPPSEPSPCPRPRVPPRRPMPRS